MATILLLSAVTTVYNMAAMFRVLKLPNTRDFVGD